MISDTYRGFPLRDLFNMAFKEADVEGLPIKKTLLSRGQQSFS